jgi:hypothetical protein
MNKAAIDLRIESPIGIIRWMKSRYGQNPSQSDDFGPIEIKAEKRCSAFCTEGRNFFEVARPGKVLAPDVEPRIIERKLFAGDRVYSRRVPELVIVAALANKSQIARHCLPSHRPRDDVFNGEGARGEMALAEAILTASVGSLRDPVTKVEADTFRGHQANESPVGSSDPKEQLHVVVPDEPDLPIAALGALPCVVSNPSKLATHHRRSLLADVSGLVADSDPSPLLTSPR